MADVQVVTEIRAMVYTGLPSVTLSADTPNGGVLVTWPDGDTLSFAGPRWDLTVVLEGIAQREAERKRRTVA